MIFGVTTTDLSLLQSAIIRNPLMTSPDAMLIDAVASMNRAYEVVRQPAAVQPATDQNHAYQRALLHQKGRSSCLVVVEADHVVGVLTASAALGLSVESFRYAQLTVGQVMQPPLLLHETALADGANLQQIYQQTHHSPTVVTNAQGSLVGLLTLESWLSLQHGPALETNEPGSGMGRVSASESLGARYGAGAQPMAPPLPQPQDTCEQNLPASQPMLQDVLSSTKACITHFRLFPDGTRIYDFCSQGSQLIYGYAPQDLVDHPHLWLSRVVPEDFQTIIMPTLEAIVEGQIQSADIEFRFRHKNGEIRWIGESCNVRWSQPQGCWMMTNVAVDITERKQLESQLRQSEAELQGLFNAMDDLVLVLDQGGHYLKIVTLDAGSLYRPAPEMMGRTLHEVFEPDQADAFLAIIQQVLTNQTSQEFEYCLTIQHQPRWFSAKCSAIAEDRVIWVARDISDRKQSEFSLRQSEAKRRAILAAMPDLMFRLGADGRYREVINPRPDLELFFQGRNPVGLRLADLVPAAIANRKLAMMQQALATGQLQVYEQQFQLDDITRHEEVRVIKSDHDEVLFMIRDITEQKRAEAILKQQLAAIEAAADGIGILQGDTYLYLNQSLVSLFGYEDPAELVNATWQKFYPADEFERFEQEIFPILQRDRVWQGEATGLRRDGSTFAQGLSLTLTDDDILICVCRDISELKQAQEQIIHNALHDPLTGLPNRTLLVDRLKVAIDRAKRSSDYRYGLLFIDLDRFKVINDSLGHLIGDKLLIAIAQRLKSHIRSTDLAVRLGGDEFVLLLDDLDRPETASQIADRILADCQTPFMIDGHEVFAGMSIGIAIGSQQYEQPSDLIRDADLAMYRAKQNRQASYQFFDSAMHTEILARHTLEMELHRAMEQQELVVYYQPIFDLVTTRLIGFEALVRWHHPSRGNLAPGQFLPCAEDSGLIVPIDRWVMAQAGQQLKQWQARGTAKTPLTMHVNLSAQNFSTGTLLACIDQTLAEVGLNYPWLTVEVTENILIEDIANATELLNQLAARHIQTSIDDFGIGYSSLQYLQQLPLQSLKIDRSFVHQIDTNERDFQMVRTIVGLGQQLNLSIIAEGLENHHQRQLVQKLGCQFGQGYLFCRPLPAEQIEPSIRALA